MFNLLILRDMRRYAYVSCLCVSASAQPLSEPLGAEQQQLGGCHVTISNCWSASNQPAAMTYLKRIQVGLGANQAYGLPELRSGDAFAAIPIQRYRVGVGIAQFGFEAYSTQRMCIAVARELSKVVSMGIVLNRHTLRIQDYGKTGTWSGTAGFILKLSEQWKLGGVVNHLNGASQVSLPPTRFDMGCAWQVSKSFLGCLEVNQSLQAPLRIRVGMRYQIHSAVTIGIGMSTFPILFTPGLMLHYKHARIDFVSQVHPVLGVTPQLALLYPSHP